MRISPVGIDDIFPGSKSLGGNLTGEPIDISSLMTFGLITKWIGTAGAAVGTMYVEMSNAVAYDKKDIPANSWVRDTGTIVAINGDGDQIYNFLSASYRWLRLVYVRTSGAGSFTVVMFNGKGV